MSGPSIEIHIASYRFSDKGIELHLSEAIPFVDANELVMLGTQYSFLFGNTQPHRGLLIGPLPVAYHYDRLVFVYGNMIKDESVKDERVIRDDYLAPYFILLFFPTSFDPVFSRCRVNIKTVIDRWFKAKCRNIKNVSVTQLQDLNVEITKLVTNEQESMYVSSNIIQTVVGKHIEFLNTIGRSLNRTLYMGIFGDYKIINLLHSGVGQNYSMIRALNSSKDGRFYVYRFPHLIIEEGKLDDNQFLDFKTTRFLSQFKWWDDCPTEFDGILFTVNIPDDPRKITKNIQMVLTKTPNYCPISLVVNYASDHSGKLLSTPIPGAIVEAKDRTISLVEIKSPEDQVERALIELFEKIIKSLQERIV
ncbi:MAG: hypothetical protein ACFFBD_10830 [Candidatus Hodarchaeota archaeon]